MKLSGDLAHCGQIGIHPRTILSSSPMDISAEDADKLSEDGEYSNTADNGAADEQKEDGSAGLSHSGHQFQRAIASWRSMGF